MEILVALQLSSSSCIHCHKDAFCIFPVVQDSYDQLISNQGICYHCATDRILKAQKEDRQNDADILINLLSALGLVKEMSGLN